MDLQQVKTWRAVLNTIAAERGIEGFGVTVTSFTFGADSVFIYCADGSLNRHMDDIQGKPLEDQFKAVVSLLREQ